MSKMFWRNDRAPVAWLRLPGIVPYATFVARMEKRVAAVMAGGREAVILAEVAPVRTAGVRDRTLRVDMVRAGHGGSTNWHGPGQLLVSPILDLRQRQPDVRGFVRLLEDIAAETLAELGVKAERREGMAGLWAGGKAIAPLALRVRRMVTSYGFAINVDFDPAVFADIAPCGIKGGRVTTAAAEGGAADMASVERAVRRAFETRFGPTLDGREKEERA